MLGAESLERAFGDHAYRRAAGTPTPVVLVGDVALDAWVHRHVVVRTSATSSGPTVQAYLTDSTTRHLVDDELRRRIARLRGRGTTSEQTQAERELGASVMSDALLHADDVDGQILLDQVVRGDTIASLRVFSAAARVLGANAPALLLTTADLDAGFRVAIALTEAAPTVPVAVTTTSESWHLWLAAPHREHAKARACVVLSTPARDDARLLAANATRSEARLAADAARSAAERALFEALEGHPASRGLFVLNQSLAVRFGSRPLEIDVACASLRIAVEVDGYFHFQDADAYRRDRRKDVALQREHWFVVRVLADDVVERLDETVATIHEAIAFISEGKSR